MPDLVADASFVHPDPAALRACGYVGVIRYLCFDGPDTHAKILFADELAALHAAGLSVRLNWELGLDDPLEGSGKGDAAGREAARQAAALGAPPALPIYYSADFDVKPDQYDAVEQYLRAAGAASGRPVGVYSSGACIEEMLRRGAATLAWQSQSVAFDGSHNPDGSPRVSPVAHLYQTTTLTLPGSGQFVAKDKDGNVFHTIDENFVFREDHAAWFAPGTRSMMMTTEEDDDVQTLAEATSDAGTVPGKRVKTGNVFLLPSGVYVDGPAMEAEYVKSGVAKPERVKMSGRAIRPFLRPSLTKH